MRSKFVALAAVALMGAAPFASARADVLYDNTTQPINYSFCGMGANYCGGDPILNVAVGGWSQTSGGAGPIAASFSTGSQAVSLNYLSLELMLASVTPSDGGSIAVTLWGGTGGSGPDGASEIALLGTISDSQLSTTFGLVSVTPTANVTLSSNQTYWVELSSGDSSAMWAYDSSGAGTGVPNEYSWNQYSGPPVTTPNSAGLAYIMQVAVPEPGSLSLIACGLIALMAARKKSRAAAAV